MKTTYLKESIMFDCAASEMHNIYHSLNIKRNAAADEARSEGKEPPKFYDIVIGDVVKIRDKYRDHADALYRRHKELSPELNEDGINNLMCAMAKSWAEDYEVALCCNGDRTELLKEAKYVVTPNIVNRINRAQKQFVQTAHAKITDIVDDTNAAPKRRDPRGYSVKNYDDVRTRCPLCGGGMYAKKIGGKYQVQCQSCALTEIVEVSNAS